MQKLINSSPTTPLGLTCVDHQDALMATLEALLASFESNASNNNPSRNFSQAQDLVSLLSSGPAITSQDTGRILKPIELLCQPSQSPIIRSAGYNVITALCNINIARIKRSNGTLRGDSVLNTLERRKIWEALCIAGGEWFPETSVARLDALEALLDIGPRREDDRDDEYENPATSASTVSANVEGLDGLLVEISSWMTSAVNSILLAHEEAHENPRHVSNYSDHSPEQSEEAFIKRLDKILSVVTMSDTIQLRELDLSKILELYSSWIDEAVRDEFRAVHAHAALSVSIISQPQVRVPRSHGRVSSASSTPTTFTFPSSIVTPAEATLGVSRGSSTNYINAAHTYHVNGNGGASIIVEGTGKSPYTILGPLFLNMVERCLKQNVLIPTETLPRVIKSACYLLALTMPSIVPPTTSTAPWEAANEHFTSTPLRVKEGRDSGVRSSASSSIRQPRSSASASQSQETSANASPRVSQKRALPQLNRDDSQDSAAAPSTTAPETPQQTIDQRIMSLVESLLHDNWYAASSLQNIKKIIFPPNSMLPKSNSENGTSPSTFTLKPPFSSPSATLISQGGIRALRFAILNALMSELAREQLNDWVANSFAMGGAPTLYGNMDQQQLLDFSWKKVAGATGGGLGVRFEKLGAGLSDCIKAWRGVHDDMGVVSRDDVLMEFCALVTDVLGLSPKGEVAEVPRFTGGLIQELAAVVKDYR